MDLFRYVRGVSVFFVVALTAIFLLGAFKVFEYKNYLQNQVHLVEVRATRLPERGSLEWKMDFEGLSFEEATAQEDVISSGK